MKTNYSEYKANVDIKRIASNAWDNGFVCGLIAGGMLWAVITILLT